MRKKIISFIILLVLAFSFAAFGCDSGRAARELAERELLEYKAAAKLELESYIENLDENDYSVENWAAILQAVTTDKAAIEAAAGQDGVDKAVEEVRGVIDGAQREREMSGFGIKPVDLEDLMPQIWEYEWDLPFISPCTS